MFNSTINAVVDCVKSLRYCVKSYGRFFCFTL